MPSRPEPRPVSKPWTPGAHGFPTLGNPVAPVPGRRGDRGRQALVASVVDDADAVAEPVGAAPLDRLPDRRQPERLAGVDREVEVLAGDVLEGVKVAAGRVAGLGPGYVEAHHALVAEAHGQLGDLQRAGCRAHRGQESPNLDGTALAATP